MTYAPVAAAAAAAVVGEQRVEACERETFDASCPPQHVILMKSARFGRMRSGRCVSQSAGRLGCQKDVLSFMDVTCSGLTSCSFDVSDLASTNACPADYISYLEAAYECVEGELPLVHPFRHALHLL